MTDLLDRFLIHVRSKNLLDLSQPTMVGYSGGPDSTCLLHLLHRGGFEVIAAHLHHGQRDEADQEMALSQAFCEELGVPFLAGRADVPKIAKSMKIGLEEAGRNARYQFFESALGATNAAAVATAHTSDDQVETVLLNIIRGCGLTGLRGIPERRERIVRPLLPFSRSETRAYCEEYGLWTHDDPANSQLDFSRAKLRKQILPAIGEISQDYAGSILRLSEIAASEDEFLNGMAAAALEKSEIKLNGELYFLAKDIEIAFDREMLLHLPPVLFRRALRLAVSAVGGVLDYHQTMIAAEGARSGASGSVTCEEGQAALEWNELTITAYALQSVLPFRCNLTVPGETISDEMGWILTAESASFPVAALPRASLTAFFNPETTKGALYFRSWKNGDEMRPLGFSGHRKVADLMSEAGLTPAARARLPIVCDMVGILWVPGVCIDERCRLDAGENCLKVTFGASQKPG